MPGAHLWELDAEASLALQGELGRWRRWKWSPPTSVTLGNLGAGAALAILGAFRRRAEVRPSLGASLGNLGAVATLAILGSLGACPMGAPTLPVSHPEGVLSSPRPSSGTSSRVPQRPTPHYAVCWRLLRYRSEEKHPGDTPPRGE